MTNKEIWFEHLLESSKYWATGMTKKRIIRNKDIILNDTDIMDDLLHRHRGSEFTPDKLKEFDEEFYKHALSNFAMDTYYLLLRNKTIKIK